MTTPHPALRERAHQWAAANTAPTVPADAAGDIDVAVFHDMAPEGERELIDRLRRRQQELWDAGLAGLDWPVDLGGHGEDADAAEVVASVLARHPAPAPHELVSVTTHLVAPTVLMYGTPDQQKQYATPFARADLLCAQLFSEPGAGSDLAGLATRATAEADHWIVNGQKVWSSGAQFANYGLLLARTDEQAVKHAGITAFLLPLDADGVQVRPLRQMSGGASFSEVFLDDVRVSDDLRIGDVGQGWSVAMATLGFERQTSGADTETGGSWHDVRQLAESTGAVDDAVLRQRLADVYIHHRLAEVAVACDRAAQATGTANPATSSMRKLQWVTGLMRISDVVADVLGPSLVGDTGTRGTFAWNAHVLGAPGYRIAGGTDEIQRTIIAERLLGLPSAPRVDKGVAWKDVPRG